MQLEQCKEVSGAWTLDPKTENPLGSENKSSRRSNGGQCCATVGKATTCNAGIPYECWFKFQLIHFQYSSLSIFLEKQQEDSPSF